MSSDSQKNLTIESLRGLAILLVVVGHVIGSAPDGGMKIDFPSPWRYLYVWIDYIQMPLFTAIAGWVYALRPISGTVGAFTVAKFKRLIVPMMAVATLYFVVQYITPGTNNKEALSGIWRIYVFPYTIFWYLQALFLIFIAVAVADKLSWMKSVAGWAGVLLASYLISISQTTLVAGHSDNIFSFEGAMYLLPYFLVGMGVKRFGNQIYRAKSLYYVLAVVGMIVLQAKWFYPHVLPHLYKCLLPIWLVPTLIILLNQRFENRVLVFFGAYAYSIYLFHGFGTAGGRIILSYFGVHSEVVVFIVAAAVATFVPILVDKLLSHSRYLAIIFLGKRL